MFHLKYSNVKSHKLIHTNVQTAHESIDLQIQLLLVVKRFS